MLLSRDTEREIEVSFQQLNMALDSAKESSSKLDDEEVVESKEEDEEEELKRLPKNPSHAVRQKICITHR